MTILFKTWQGPSGPEQVQLLRDANAYDTGFDATPGAVPQAVILDGDGDTHVVYKNTLSDDSADQSADYKIPYNSTTGATWDP